jgi:hypothetical protein
MLRQEELAFLKAIENVELSPVFLRELRKAVASGPTRPTLLAFRRPSDPAESARFESPATHNKS